MIRFIIEMDDLLHVLGCLLWIICFFLSVHVSTKNVMVPITSARLWSYQEDIAKVIHQIDNLTDLLLEHLVVTRQGNGTSRNRTQEGIDMNTYPLIIWTIGNVG